MHAAGQPNCAQLTDARCVVVQEQAVQCPTNVLDEPRESVRGPALLSWEAGAAGGRAGGRQAVVDEGRREREGACAQAHARSTDSALSSSGIAAQPRPLRLGVRTVSAWD